MQIQGRTAVVTGAASGLGRATATLLAGAGAHVALVDRDEESLVELAVNLGEGAMPLPTDLTDTEQVRRTVMSVTEVLGGVHVLVNAAGIAPAARIVHGDTPSDLDDFRRVIDVNLIGTFDMMRWCAVAMGRNDDDGAERGVIVNVSSGAAWQGQKGQAAYAASKAAVVGLTLPVARDLADQGIRVVAIAPGLFETSMVAGMPDRVRESLEAMALHPSRMGDPEEFAMLVRHIVENPYLNATTVSIDAGIRMT
ncbi:SDR family NAD(P)-dependent oxidoreductase [Aeromicrobium sp. CTD01-1L150]|uniref:SDR family NAD(P)-dependent oxidoreductase n=1 Tax=Aeromicrobium sp. CTD01-1L150 TaxID=3341830 RepID=UPI0035C1C20B